MKTKLLYNNQDHRNLDRLKKRFGHEVDILKNCKEWICIEVDSAIAVVMINPYISQDCALFGFIEFPNDAKIADELFRKMETRARMMGAQSIAGPINFATWIDYRWMTDGWNYPRVYPGPENEAYMPQLIQEHGYTPAERYNSGCIKNDEQYNSLLKRRYGVVLNDGFSFQRYDKNSYHKISSDLFVITCNAFDWVPFYCPIDYEFFKSTFLGFVDTVDSVIDVCVKDDHICGYCISFINPFYNQWLIVPVIAVSKKYQRYNIGSAFMHRCSQDVHENDASNIVIHLRHEKSNSHYLGQSDLIVKRYAVFKKEL